MPPRPPEYEEVKRSESVVDTGLQETLGFDSTEDHLTYHGGWLSVAVFGLSNATCFFIPNEGVVSVTPKRRYRYQDTLPDIDFKQYDKMRFHNSETIVAKETFDSFEDEAAGRDGEPRLLLYGSKENFWQQLASFRLAEQGYVVFPESLSEKWTYGVPDLTCFQFGELQEVLADIGIVPNGASLIEAELRSKYDLYDSQKIEVGSLIGAVEVKRDAEANGKPKTGLRDLTSYRGSKDKSPYLAGNSIEKGWLVCPNAADVLEENDDTVGGITWDAESESFYEAPTHDIDQAAQAEKIDAAKETLLTWILRHQPLSEPLSQVVQECIKKPEKLYSIYS